MLIYNGIWWSYIRYDHKVSDDKCDEAVNLCNVVLLSWVFQLTAITLGLFESIVAFFRCKGCTVFIGILTSLVGIAMFVVNCMEIDYSKASKCDAIDKNGLVFGRNSSDFLKWLEDNDDKASDLKYYQCNK